MMKAAMAALGATALPSASASPKDPARAKAVARPRRVIWNNDGNDAWTTDAPATPEGFLSIRMNHVSDCQLDSVFYCTAESSVYTHRSKILEPCTSNAGILKHNRTADLWRAGTDPLQLAVEWCRKRQAEVFWSLRMNDIHDNWFPEIRAKWKGEHPELVMGTAAETAPYGMRDPRFIWTLMDFERPEIRDLMVRGVAEVLENYDVDGIDLDFLRHICYFRESRLYQPVTPAHRDLMTAMVARIRSHVLAASQRRGRPVLLSARVPQTMELNQHFGLDLERWIEMQYLDFITVGAGFDPFTSPEGELAKWCHDRGVPAYGCITSEGLSQEGWSGPPLPNSDLSEKSAATWLGAAANNWASGVDGIMTFNLFPERGGVKLTQDVLRTIADPKKLEMRDKLYCIEHLHDDDYCWMLRSVPRNGRLPVTIEKGATVSRILPVADDIPSRAGRVKSLRLRLYLDCLREPDKVSVALNGAKLVTAPDGPQWLSTDVSPSVMRKGPNELAITFEMAKSLSWALTLRSVELKVQYV